jgi:hypothetical protein
MQLTIYYNDDDKWLIEKVKTKAHAERKSTSAVILSILAESLGETRQTARSRKRRKTRAPKSNGS